MATHELAKGLAGLGRNGDSVLVHMQPQEVAGLQYMAKLNGTTLTINPHTGMPEAFNLGRFLGSLAPMLVGIALAPATAGGSLLPAIAGGAATGAGVSAINGDDVLTGGLMGGLGGYGGAGLGGTFAKMGSGATAAPTAAPTAAATSPSAALTTTPVGQGGLNVGQGFTDDVLANSAVTNTTIPSQITGTTGEVGVNLGQTQGVGTSFGAADEVLTGQGAGAGVNTNTAIGSNMGQVITPPTFGERMGNVGEGIKQLGSQGGYEAFKNAGGSAMQLGLPIGGALLNGITPEYEPRKKKQFGILNLNEGEPLNLDREYADGGMIDAPQNAVSSGGLGSLFENKDGTMAQNTPMAGYGYGGSAGYAQGGMLHGPGDGMSDSIPATIEGRQPARLADGEFVVPADVVSHLGNGSTKAGSQRLYGMMDKVRKARTGTKKQGKQINPNKYMP